MGTWDAAVERGAMRLVQAACGAGRSPADRDRSWQRLLVEIVPHLERWLARSTILRRVDLAGDDDVRTVLVDVIARLHDRDCQNLRDFLASEPVDPDELDELELIGELSLVASDADGDEQAPLRLAPLTQGERGPDPATPLRAWLLTLCRFVAKDHVKRRFGWTSLARLHLPILGDEPEPRTALVGAFAAHAGVIEARWKDGGVIVLYRPGSTAPQALVQLAAGRGWTLGDTARALRSKRDLYSGADRLATGADRGERPPITDLVTAREVVAQIRAYMATLPADMNRALELWMSDASFEEIAATINVAVPSARALVRAGQARLRERFRPAAPALFGA